MEKVPPAERFRIDSRSRILYNRGQKGRDAVELSKMLTAWAEQTEKYRSGEINREDYDKWCYYYPEFDATQKQAKIMSQGLSDLLIRDN